MISALKNGYVTEQMFIVEAMKNDITVSKPVTNTEIYDFIVDCNNKLFTVQVKKSWDDKKGRHIVSLRGRYPRSNIRHNLSDRVDFLATYCNGENNWYIIPTHEIKDINSNIAIRNTGNYAKYINNWNFNI
jgi:hypothetical protein